MFFIEDIVYMSKDIDFTKVDTKLRNDFNYWRSHCIHCYKKLMRYRTYLLDEYENNVFLLGKPFDHRIYYEYKDIWKSFYCNYTMLSGVVSKIKGCVK